MKYKILIGDNDGSISAKVLLPNVEEQWVVPTLTFES